MSTEITNPPAAVPEGTTRRPRSIPAIAILLGSLALLGIVGFALSFGAFRIVRAPGAEFDSGGPGLQGGPGQRFFGPGTGGAARAPNFQANPGGPGGGPRTFSGGGLLSFLGPLGTALPILRVVWVVLLLVLTSLATWFVWKQRRWALNLGMILAALVLLGSLPGLLFGGRSFFMGGFGMLQTGLDVLRVAIAAPIIVLGMLPSVRDYFS